MTFIVIFRKVLAISCFSVRLVFNFITILFFSDNHIISSSFFNTLSTVIYIHSPVETLIAIQTKVKLWRLTYRLTSWLIFETGSWSSRTTGSKTWAFFWRIFIRSWNWVWVKSIMRMFILFWFSRNRKLLMLIRRHGAIEVSFFKFIFQVFQDQTDYFRWTCFIIFFFPFLQQRFIPIFNHMLSPDSTQLSIDLYPFTVQKLNSCQ